MEWKFKRFCPLFKGYLKVATAKVKHVSKFPSLIESISIILTRVYIWHLKSSHLYLASFLVLSHTFNIYQYFPPNLVSCNNTLLKCVSSTCSEFQIHGFFFFFFEIQGFLIERKLILFFGAKFLNDITIFRERQ